MPEESCRSFYRPTWVAHILYSHTRSLSLYYVHRKMSRYLHFLTIGSADGWYLNTLLWRARVREAPHTRKRIYIKYYKHLCVCVCISASISFIVVAAVRVCCSRIYFSSKRYVIVLKINYCAEKQTLIIKQIFFTYLNGFKQYCCNEQPQTTTVGINIIFVT